MIYTRVADRSTTLFDQRTPLPHTPSPLPPPHPSFFDTYALVRAHYRIPREQGGAQHNAAKKREGSDKIWGFRTGVSRTPAGTHAFFARNLPTVRYISSPPPCLRAPLVIIRADQPPLPEGKTRRSHFLPRTHLLFPLYSLNPFPFFRVTGERNSKTLGEHSGN